MTTFSGIPVVSINGTVVTVANLPPIQDIIGQRGQTQLTIVDTAGTLALRDGQSVVITDGNGLRIWSGFVVTAIQQRIAYYDVNGGTTGAWGWQLTCVDATSLADRKIAASTYANETCGAIVRDLTANFLASEGVTGNGAAPTFTRSSVAYDDAGVQDAANAPRYASGQYGQALRVEEATTNLLSANQSSVETDTTGFTAVGTPAATLARDAGTAWSGSASLKAICDGTAAGQGVSATLPDTSLTAGGTYALSCYLKGSGTVRLALAGVAASSFVKTSGTRFVLNGSRFTFVGFNFYDIVEHYTPAQMLSTFQTLAGYGVTVVRLWAFGESTVTTSPPAWCFQYGATGGVWNEAAFVQLDNAIHAAAQCGIKLILCCANQWTTYGGKAVYVQWYNAANATSYQADDFNNISGIETLYKNYLNKLITRTNTVTGTVYSADPTIMAWECGNEMRFSGTTASGAETNADTPSSAYLSIMTNWYTAISQYIKSLDSNHLVGTGSISQAYDFQNTNPFHNGTTSYGLDFNLQHQIASIDYCDTHWYWWSDPNNDGNLTNRWATAAGWYGEIAELCQWARSMNKPLLVGETGMDKRSTLTTPISYYPRDAYLQLVWQTFLQQGAAGVNLWEWHDDVDTGIHDTTSSPPANAPDNQSDATLLSFVTSQNAALSSPQAITLTSEWQRATLIVTLPTPLPAGQYGIQVATDRAQAVTFWVDGLQIEAKGYATSWQIGGTARGAEAFALPTAGVLSPTAGTVAVRAWVDATTRRQGAGFNRLLQIPRSGQTTSGITLYHDQNSPNWNLASDDDSGHTTTVTVPDYLTPDGWHLFHIVWSAAQLALYLDGTLAGSAANPVLTAAFGPTWWAGSASSFNEIDTVLDAVKASVAAKTAAQVQDEWASSLTGNLFTPNQSDAETNTLGFTGVGGPTHVTLTQDTAPPGGAWHGTAALKATTDGLWSYQGVEVRLPSSAFTPGGTYTLSGYLMASAGTPSVRFYCQSDVSNVGDVSTVQLSTSWQRFSVTVTLPNPITQQYFALRWDTGDPPQALTVWMDGLQCEAGSVATAWRLGTGGTLALTPGDTYLLACDGTLVPATPIQDGPTLTTYPVNYEPVSKHLDALAQLAGFYWSLDAYRVLTFAAYNTTPAPFVFDGSQAVDPDGNTLLTIEHSSPMYRNGQYILGITEVTSTQTETRQGDGKATAFLLSYPLHAVPTITLNGTAQTVGIANVDSGKQWYWSKGSNTISQDSSGTKLVSTDTLQVVYVGEYNTLVYAQDDGEVTTQQMLEGNTTSGLVEQATTDTSITTTAQGFQVAAGLLGKYATAGKILSFKTLTPGLQSGMLLTVDLPEAPWNISGEDFLIESVVTTFDGFQWWYDVQALEGPVDDTWVKFFTRLAATATVIDTSSSGVSQTVSLLQQFDAAWNWAASLNVTTYACPLFPWTLPVTLC